MLDINDSGDTPYHFPTIISNYVTCAVCPLGHDLSRSTGNRTINTVHASLIRTHSKAVVVPARDWDQVRVVGKRTSRAFIEGLGCINQLWVQVPMRVPLPILDMGMTMGICCDGSLGRKKEGGRAQGGLQSRDLHLGSNRLVSLR